MHLSLVFQCAAKCSICCTNGPKCFKVLQNARYSHKWELLNLPTSYAKIANVNCLVQCTKHGKIANVNGSLDYRKHGKFKGSLHCTKRVKIANVNGSLDYRKRGKIANVNGLLFIPVKVDATASDNRPRLVNVIDLDDAVKVTNTSRTASGPEASAGQEVEAKHPW